MGSDIDENANNDTDVESASDVVEDALEELIAEGAIERSYDPFTGQVIYRRLLPN